MKTAAFLGILLFVSGLSVVHDAMASDDLESKTVEQLWDMELNRRLTELRALTIEQLFDRAVGFRTVSFLYANDRPPYTGSVDQNWLFSQGGDFTISENETWGDRTSEAFLPIEKLKRPVPMYNTMDWPNGDLASYPPRVVDYDILQLNRLHVTGPVEITIPSRPLLIQVVEVDFDRGASLTFSGGPVLVQAQRLSPHSDPSGSVCWPCFWTPRLTNRVRVSPNADSDTRYYTNFYPQSVYLLGGDIKKGIDSSQPFIELSKRISDVGILRLHGNLQSELQHAILAQQRSKAIHWAKLSTVLPSLNQASPFIGKLNELQTAILNQRKQLEQQLLRRTVSTKTRDGISRSVAVYARGDSLENDIEPDTATLEIQNPQSRSVGILTKDPESVDQLRLYLRLRLSADPWTADLVGRRLSEDGEVLRGLFTRRVLKATGFPPGVIKANINQDNDLLDMDLTLSRALAGTFLAQLTLPLGVPFTFSWTSTEDPAISGDGLTFRVSLQRNVNAEAFNISDGAIRNNSSRSIKIAYARVNDKLLAFDPPLVVKHSESKKLPIDQKTTRSLEIPRAAVTWPDIDPSAAALMFDIPDQNEVLQSISVENHLSVYDQLKNRHLQKVLLEVEYEVRASTGNIIKVPGERVSLAPAGGRGNSATLRFIKPQSGSVTVIVSGRAIYDIEQVALKTKRFDTFAVNIGNDMLP